MTYTLAQVQLIAAKVDADQAAYEAWRATSDTCLCGWSAEDCVCGFQEGA